MKAKELYAKLEKDFVKPGMEDDWSDVFNHLGDLVSPQYRKRSIGVMCDFALEVKKVFTGVFASNEVLQKIIKKDVTDAMLFVHHPTGWHLVGNTCWVPMTKENVEEFKRRRISIFNFHVPLDDYGKYSTGMQLCKALDLKPIKSFSPYHGAMAGVVAKTKLKTVQELAARYENAVGHKVKLFRYGTNGIIDSKVAVIGGGNELEDLEYMKEEGINVLVTGVTLKNERRIPLHKFAEKNELNIIGGTHYSSEKFACIAMCDYFKKLGLESEFVEGEAFLSDL